jgi:hypothetical protein
MQSKINSLSIGERLSELLEKLCLNTFIGKEIKNEIASLYPCMLFVFFYDYFFVVVRLGQLDAHEEADSFKLSQIHVDVDDDIFPSTYSSCCSINFQSKSCVHECCYKYNKSHKGFILFPNNEKICCFICCFICFICFICPFRLLDYVPFFFSSFPSFFGI